MTNLRIVAISDHCTVVPPEPILLLHHPEHRVEDIPAATAEKKVIGGYLERLPLAWVAAGHANHAEIWSFAGRDGDEQIRYDTTHGLTRRVFRAAPHEAPYGSRSMLSHIAASGPPDILCVWGLGVEEDILSACSDSIKIYNSIDVPPLRIPQNLGAHFDIFLAASDWQAIEIRSVYPDAVIHVLPIGPEFASGDTFKPLGLQKIYDVIYVAAAQPYKQHRMLFAALAKLPKSFRCLCVIGYGELADALRAETTAMDLSVDFVGPPGVSHDEVNALMNQARVGVVCGANDGAPAILTEYMLAGLPVLANADLRCGLQYITAETGRTATVEDFHTALSALVSDVSDYAPREVVMRNWAWPQSVKQLEALVAEARRRRALKVRAAG